MESLTSRNNPLVSESAKLKEKKYRDQSGLFFFEGEKLFLEALACKLPLVRVFFLPEMAEKYQNLALPCPAYTVPMAVYEKMSEEKSPQGVLCVAKYLDFLHNRYIIYSSEVSLGKVFLAGQIRDPGNLGTMIRTANALGIHTLCFSDDCADIYHPRTIRAAMGALFRQKIIRLTKFGESIPELRKAGYHVYAAALRDDALSLCDTRIAAADPHTAFLVGNEGHGLPSEWISQCDASVLIPMQPGSESLNAAVAAAILMWEATRKAPNESLQKTM